MNALKNAARLAAMAASASAGRIDAAAPARRAWFAGDKEIFTRPRDDGDCRYPYGSDGFNFWAYTSGYMHSNEGIFSPFLRSAEGQEPKLCWFAGFPTEAGNKIGPSAGGAGNGGRRGAVYRVQQILCDLYVRGRGDCA